MPPLLRKGALAVHVLVSIGWIGAVAAYLTLGVAAEISQQASTVRASWVGMELIGWLVIVPLGCLALTTGIVMSLGTPWGLVRHYWVLMALVLTAIALGVLLLHMPSVGVAAEVARRGDDPAVLALGGDVVHPSLGLGLLVVVAVLNVYKPRGLTGLGHRRHAPARELPTSP